MKVILSFILLISIGAKSQIVLPLNNYNLEINSIDFQEEFNNTLLFTYTNYSRLQLLPKERGVITIDTTDSIRKTPFNLKYKNTSLYFVDSKVINNKVVVFASFWNLKHRKEYLFASIQNTDKNQNLKWHYTSERLCKEEITTNNFKVSISNNNNGIAISSIDYNITKDDSLTINITTLDSSFNKIFIKKISIKRPDISSTMKKLLIKNNNEVSLLMENRMDLKPIDGTKFYIREYVLIHSNNNMKTPRAYKLELENKYIANAIINLTQDDKLMIGGYYSEQSFATIKGLYIMEQGTDRLNTIAINEFSYATIAKYRPIDILDKRFQNEISIFDAQNIINDNNGNIFIISELRTNYYNYYTTAQASTYYGISPIGTYDFGDIMICKVDTKTSNSTEMYISKNQRYIPYVNMSYSYSFNKNIFTFVFNKSLKKDFKYKTRNKGVTSVVKVNTDGEIISDTTFPDISACNPLVLSPKHFAKDIYLLNNILELEKARIIEIP